MGHRAGRRSVREVVEGCVGLGVKVLTLYTFSLENWERTAGEVRGLMRILEQVLREEREELKKLERDHKISEDDAKKSQAEIQKLHDKYIAVLDDLFHKKQAEVMEV